MEDMDNEGMTGGGRDLETMGKEIFSMTYTGNFKPNQHIPSIWDGICELMEENEGFAKDFRLQFVGNVDASAPEYFNQKGFDKNVELVSYVPHAEVTRIMSDSSLLLFVIPQSRNNSLIITGKLFEYLASGSTILSVGPVDGDAAAILKDTRREAMLDYSDKDTFKQVLMAKYKQWKEGKLKKLDISVLDKYSRRSSAERMAGIMNEITS
jgi:hypothetical protein